jgi:hypothetical protein
MAIAKPILCRSKNTTLPTFQIRPILESEIEILINNVGGKRAHVDANRELPGADFVLGSSVIELKMLEEEGLEKKEKQEKIAKLFTDKFPNRPTIVLDKHLLDDEKQREYDNILEGTLKSEIRTARKQLKQSSIEYQANSNVLWIINNGHISLSHNALLDLALKRVMNDSTNIDAVVVSGVYFYSDGFERFFLWPIDYRPINLDRGCQEYDALLKAWGELANEWMTILVRDPAAVSGIKGPVVDISFSREGKNFVLPTPPMGHKSDFYIKGRPRQNSTGITTSPRVATVFAGISELEWNKFIAHNPPGISTDNYIEWKSIETEARANCSLKPFITIPVTCEGWKCWKKEHPRRKYVTIHGYANSVFQAKMLDIINNSKEKTDNSILPPRFMLVITEEIGQDLAFDVSRLAEVRIDLDGNDHIKIVWEEKALFFEHALVIAAAEAIARGIDYVFWKKDKTYAWF